MLSPDPHLKEEEKKEHTVEKRREGKGRRGKKNERKLEKGIASNGNSKYKTSLFL